MVVKFVGFQRADGTIEERTIHLKAAGADDGLDAAVQELINDLTAAPGRAAAEGRLHRTLPTWQPHEPSDQLDSVSGWPHRVDLLDA